MIVRSRIDMKQSVLGIICFLLVVSCGGVIERAARSPALGEEGVTFRLKSPAARTVQIAGDWQGNNWGRGDAEAGEVLVGLMERSGTEGIWEITIALRPGRYRYRFIIDEVKHVLDPDNPRVVDDGIGGRANLLIVP
jgi:1,4-alpha-glucan branching enzyme